MLSGMENGYLLSFPLQEPHARNGGKQKSERQDQGTEEEMVLCVGAMELLISNTVTAKSFPTFVFCGRGNFLRAQKP